MFIRKLLSLRHRDKFSLFATLGNLSHYTLEELKLKTTDKFSFNKYIDNDLIVATWTDKNFELVIYYNLNETFLKIHSEYWIKSKNYFIR